MDVQHAAPIYYRGDMLEELGAEVPTTVDEFYDLLVLAKEHYADVEGFYPFLSQPSYIHNNLFPAFGDAYQVPYGDNGDGKVTYNYATDQFRRYLEFVHKLYAEGLINPEIFTMDAATINAQVKAGQCFFLGNVGTQLTGEHYASGEVETKILPPLVSEWTDEMKTLAIATLGYAGRTINANTENPEYLLRYLDMFYTEIGEADINVSGVSSWLGTQGVNWDITEDGQCYYRIVPEKHRGPFGRRVQEQVRYRLQLCGHCGAGSVPDQQPHPGDEGLRERRELLPLHEVSPDGWLL